MSAKPRFAFLSEDGILRLHDEEQRFMSCEMWLCAMLSNFAYKSQLN